MRSRSTRCAQLLALVALLATQTVCGPVMSELINESDGASLSGVFDGAYMIGLQRCEERWEAGLRWAARTGLELTQVHATEFDDVSLTHPPIPVINLPNRTWATAGQVGCTASHIRVWRDAFVRNLTRVLVLEDDVHLTDRLVRDMPSLLQAADAGAAIRGVDWHYMYLRAYATHVFDHLPPPWHPSEPRLRYAAPAWGTAAYVLSAAGVRLLLTRITAYTHPLDVQIERLQLGLDTQGARFVALDTCDPQEKGAHGCPENVQELSHQQKGDCFYSASQAGGFRAANLWPRI